MSVFTNFHEIRLPTSSQYPAQGGASYGTEITPHVSGHEKRTSHWEVSRGYYEATFQYKTVEEFAELKTFFVCRRGRFYGFRYKNPLDYRTNPNGVTTKQIGTGNGSTLTFQLNKTYSDSEGTYTRNIYKPVNNGTLQVFKVHVLQVEGVDFTCDYTTGILTFAVAPAAAVNAYCEFDTPVRFGVDKLEASLVFFDQHNFTVPLVELRPR